MSSFKYVKTPTGQTWAIGSYVGTSADVIIPATETEGMTDEEIAAAVRALTPQAILFNVEEQAICYLEYFPAMFVPSDLEADKRLFEEYAPQSLVAAKALVLIRDFEKRRAEEEAAEIERRREKRRADRRRRYVGYVKHYDQFFTRLVRRDGYECAACGATDVKLEIDHIIPLSLGGASILDNMQLLCRPCNQRKGVSSTDYRKTA